MSIALDSFSPTRRSQANEGQARAVSHPNGMITSIEGRDPRPAALTASEIHEWSRYVPSPLYRDGSTTRFGTDFRFPSDFMFLLTSTEWDSLRPQFATLESGRGRHRKFLPYAFTEHGALMAAGVLNSPRAIEMSIYLVKAFVELRKTFADHQELSRRLNDLEDNIERKLSMHDKAIADILSAIRNLMTPPKGTHRPIGFVTPRER